MPISADNACDLHGTTVVVTRAVSQAQSLCDLIRECNGLPLLLPALEIRWLALTKLQCQALLEETESRPPVVVFTSPNAVESVARAMKSYDAALRPGINCIAIGSGTAAALNRLGQRAEVAQPSTSEGVAQMAALAQPENRDLIIVRGEGGRELLASLLRSTGWSVDEIIGYRRDLPSLDSGPVFDQWRVAHNVVVTFLSGDTASNLVQIARLQGRAEQDLVKSTPVAVISERVRDVVRSLGWQAPIAVARTISAQAMPLAVSSVMKKT